MLFVGAEDSGLQIVNVTDPYNPYMIGNWSDPTGDIGQVYVMSNYAFVATRIPDISGPPTYQDLKVLDVSDPSNISYISTVDLGGSFNGGAPRAHNNDLVFFNDHAFGLKILDFSNPLDVSIIGNFSDGGFYNDVELVDDEIAFLADDYFGLIENLFNEKKNTIITTKRTPYLTNLAFCIVSTDIGCLNLSGTTYPANSCTAPNGQM